MPPVCRTQGGTTILPVEDACIVSHPSDISRPLRSCSRKRPLTRRQSGARPFQRRRKARNCHRLYICKDRIFSEPPQEDKIGFFGPPRLIPTFSVPDRDIRQAAGRTPAQPSPPGKIHQTSPRRLYIFGQSSQTANISCTGRSGACSLSRQPIRHSVPMQSATPSTREADRPATERHPPAR